MKLQNGAFLSPIFAIFPSSYRTDRQICAVILKQLYIVYDGMLQSLFLYFWPKQEICTVFVFKLVEVSLCPGLGFRIKAFTVL